MGSWRYPARLLRVPPIVVALLIVGLLCGGVSGAVTVRSGEELTGDARAAGLGGAAALDDQPEAPPPLAQGTATSAAPPASSTPVGAPRSTTSTVRPRTSTTAGGSATTAPAGQTSTTVMGSAPKGTTGLFTRYPGQPTVPYQPGQSSWSGVSEGITLKVSMEPASPKAGEAIRFVLEASTPVESCCLLYMWFGDDFGWPGLGQPLSCAVSAPRKRAEVVHTYNTHGRWEFMFGALACDGPPRGVLFGSLDVAPGAGSAQGPSLPVVRIDGSTPYPEHDGDRRYLSIFGQAIDDDGYVDRMALDWGDGSPVQVLDGDLQRCRTSASGWPLPSVAWSPNDPRPWHRYDAPGTYKVTITAFSTGCDGSAEQRGSAALSWSVPA